MYLSHCVVNSRNKTVLYNGKVRLRNGAYPSLGRIEVYCSGLWGVVCGDIRKEEADKVCRQLGYTGADRFGFKLRFVQAEILSVINNCSFLELTETFELLVAINIDKIPIFLFHALIQE